LRLKKAGAVIDTAPPISPGAPTVQLFDDPSVETHARRPITDVRILRGKHDIWKPRCYFSVCFAFAAAANAQLAETDSPSERDDRTASLPPAPGTSEEAPPAHNGPAATANSLSICQPQTACRSNSLLESFGRRAALGLRPDAVGPITRTGQRRPIYACDGRRAVSSRSLSIRSKRCRSLPSSCASCEPNSAISG